MKVYKPGTDCEVDFTVYANESACKEYVLPEADDEPTAGICFIAVPDDEARITIHGTFTGSVLYGRVDVLADGAFVANRVIEDQVSKESIIKYWDKRKVDVKTYLHVPNLSDHKTRLRPKVVEGSLVTKRLSDKELAGPLHGGDDATGIGVGSIALVVSLNQQAFDTYGSEGGPAYPSVTLGSWRDSIADVTDSGIKPEHEAGVDVFPDSNPVKDKRATLFWRDTKAVRFGNEPWAYLIFYYRTQAAIDTAGCVPLTESKALPADEAVFLKASDQQVLAVPQAESLSSTPSPMPAPGPRRSMGLGQALFLPGNGQPPSEVDPQLLGSANNSEKDSFFDCADDTLPMTRFDEPINATSPEDEPQSNAGDAATTMRHSIFTKRIPQDVNLPPVQDSRSRVTFADPPTIEPVNNNSLTNATMYTTVDDLASPFRSPESRTPTVMSPSNASRSFTTQSSTKPSDSIKPALQLPPHKRPISQSQPSTSISTTPASTESPPPAKRMRSEEMARRKAQLQADLQAKRERKAAMQKQLEDEKLHRAKQQQLWAEEDARRREEEARRRAEEEARRVAEAEEEARRTEEAELAELEALERENELEDEDVARTAEETEMQRREWADLIRAREQGHLD